MRRCDKDSQALKPKGADQTSDASSLSGAATLAGKGVCLPHADRHRMRAVQGVLSSLLYQESQKREVMRPEGRASAAFKLI